MEAVGGDTSILNIHDLQQVWTELKEFPLRNWREFGLTAGLYYTTLSNIEANSTKVEDHFMECLSCWLKRKDNVNKQGMPTWRRLEKILEELGEQALADRVRGLSSDAHEEQQVEPVTTSGHSIYLPEYLEDEYFRMTTEFANILKRFVIQIFKEKEKLKDVKMSLVGIRPSRRKEINEVDDETELIQVLRNYCSLRKFPILTTLARDMKMSDITKELNQFEEKRKRLYEEILAKDFAKSAIEYCGTTGSREVTFEVLWPIDRTTLDDFEQFLAAAFRSQDINMLIHLKTVHSSRLTFVCVIPHWLVEEMKDYIVKNGDLFESKGVVEITVDGAIVFSVKHSLEPHQLPSDSTPQLKKKSNDEMPSDDERGHETPSSLQQKSKTEETLHKERAESPGKTEKEKVAVQQDTASKGQSISQLTIMVVGKTGVGKSTLINSMLGKKVARAPDSIHPSNHDTIEKHTGTVCGTPVVFYDTRGLGDPKLNDKELMDEFKQLMKQCGDQFTILICQRFIEKFDDSVVQFAKLLAKYFKNDYTIWKNCNLVLTKANLYNPDDDESDEEEEGEEDRSDINLEEVLKLKMNIRMKEWAIQFRLCLIEYNVPEKLIMNMPVCVAGNKKNLKLLTDNWIKTIIDQCHMTALHFQLSAEQVRRQSKDVANFFSETVAEAVEGVALPFVGIPIGTTIGSLIGYGIAKRPYQRTSSDSEEKEFHERKKMNQK